MKIKIDFLISFRLKNKYYKMEALKKQNKMELKKIEIDMKWLQLQKDVRTYLMIKEEDACGIQLGMWLNKVESFMNRITDVCGDETEYDEVWVEAQLRKATDLILQLNLFRMHLCKKKVQESN